MPFDQVQDTQNAAAPETDDQQEQPHGFQKLHQPSLNDLKSIKVTLDRPVPTWPSRHLLASRAQTSYQWAPGTPRANQEAWTARSPTARSGFLPAQMALHRNRSSNADPGSGPRPSNGRSAAWWILLGSHTGSRCERTLEAFQRPGLIF